jgi:ubiquinone biosynthesis protein
MEYIHGIKITDMPRIKAAGLDANRLIHLVGDVYMEQMLRHGHFHADPHPGNIFALEGNRLALLDFGLTKRFSREFHIAFRALAKGIYGGDNEALVDELREAGFKYKKENDPAAAMAMAEAFRAFSSPETYRDRAVMDVVNRKLNAVERNNPMVDMPGEIALASRVMGLLLALIFTAGEDIDFAGMILKYAAEPKGVPA